MTEAYVPFLENPVRERVKAILDENPECGNRLCADAVERVCKCIDAQRQDFSDTVATCALALRALGDVADACRRALLPNAVSFSQSDAPFPAVCVFLMHLEEKRAALAEAMIPCFSMRERGGECHMQILSARSTVCAVCETVGESAYADASVHALNQAEEVLERTVRSFDSFCHALYTFSADVLPHFERQLREEADFHGKGKSCDPRRIGGLCESLQLAAYSIEIPKIE